MPNIGTDGSSGNGYDPKTRLDLAGMQGGKDDEPITRAEMRDVMRQITDWSNRLRFGRVGFTAEMLPLTQPGVLVSNPVKFNRLVEDSSSFSKTYLPGDELTYFQVPPGQGAVYAVSYNVDFALLVSVTDTYNVTAALQTWTAPAGLLFNTVTIRAKGGAGNYTGNTLKARQGLGRDIQAKYTNVDPGDIFDVYVGQGDTNQAAGAIGWPDGGMNAASGGSGSSGSGGGSSQVRPQGGALATAIIIAGGGGGGERGTVGSNPPKGGNASTPTGAATDGNNDVGTVAGRGATQSAGGTCNIAIGEAGDTDGQGFGGDAIDIANSFSFSGGGGGGGWHGGGSGGSGAGSGNHWGSGGGGTSKVQGGINIVDNGTNSGTGQVTFTYYTSTPAAVTDVTTKVYVAYANWPDKAPYEMVTQILGDNGASPQNASISIPLGEGDRIWMVYSNAAATLGVINFNLSAYATGT